MAPPNLEPHFEVGGTRYRCWNLTTKSVVPTTEAGTSLRSRWNPPPMLEPHYEVGGTRHRCWNPTAKSVVPA